MSEPQNTNRREAAIGLIKARNGWIRMVEALDAGINRWTLYSLRDAGVIEQVSRGVYRLSDEPRFLCLIKLLWRCGFPVLCCA